jgi:PqqD family protein of HPr-rel-A system
MTATSRWARSPEVAWVEASEYTVVLRLDEARPSPRSLDATASAIWASLDEEPRSLDAIVGELAEAYGVAPEKIADDVRGFLADLHDLGLVTRDEAR